MIPERLERALEKMRPGETRIVDGVRLQKLHSGQRRPEHSKDDKRPPQQDSAFQAARDKTALSCLKEGSKSANEIASVIGEAHSTTTKRMRRLADAGKCARDGRKYCLSFEEKSDA